MLSDLRAARADQTHDRKMLRFTSPDVLIIDDLGLGPLELDEPIDLYEIIRQRYEVWRSSPPRIGGSRNGTHSSSTT